MFDMTRKLVRKTSPNVACRRLGNLFLCVSLVLVFGLVDRGTAAAADAQSLPVASVGPGPQFAIADLDGDVRPDFVSIESGSKHSGTTNYSIQLQLSAVGRRFIQLAAPAGGLRIETRDVNGDHAVDLVLATAWFNRPVAVFLNNGHGGFSRAEPTAFPGAFTESRTKWASGSNQAIGAVGVPSQSRGGISADDRRLRGRSPTESIPAATSGFPVSSCLISHVGRAPPSEVLHF
jgi:hypothetical protein